MLRIRLSRTGRKNFPSYRIVVAEHTSAVKKGAVDIIGNYIPTRTPKVLEYDEKKIKEWISKGAKPTDTVAALLKNAGVSGMDQYLEPRNKKKKSKKAQAEGSESAPAAPAPTAAPAAPAPTAAPAAPEAAPAPAVESKPAAEEAPAVETKPEPQTPEAPKQEEPAPQTPEAPKQEEAAQEAPEAK